MKQHKLKQTEIGMIPEDWGVVEIKDLGKVSTGKTPPTSNERYWGKGISFITPADLSDSKYVDVTDRKVTQEGAELVRILPKNTVMVVCIGSTIGKTGIIKNQGITNQQINSIICKEGVDFNYVYYTLDNNSSLFKSYSGVAAVPIINKTLFEKIKVPIPSFSEQKNISEVLSTIDNRLDIVERESQRVERLKVGLMKELFDGKKWPSIRLGDENFFEMNMGQSPPSELYNRDGIGLPFLQGNADFGDLHPSPTIYCSKPLKVAKAGDILISVRAPVGEVNTANVDYCIGRGVGAIRAKKDVDSKFLFFYLKSVNSKLDSISGGSTFKAITKNQLEKLEVFLPPITEQKKISLILSTIDKKLSIQQSKKSKLESIKKSLMNDLLTGKKRVKVTQ